MRKLVAMIVAASLWLTLVPLAAADPGTQSWLTPIRGSGTGRILISPTARDGATFTFDAQVTVELEGVRPNTTYLIQRAVTRPATGTCTTHWITSPVETLTTSAGGAGATHFELRRGSPFGDGVTFNVIWRVFDGDGSEFRSDCLTVTVK